MTSGVTCLPGLEQAAQEMPFDQFGRYHMLREAVDACRAQLGVQQLTILDVGGFMRTTASRHCRSRDFCLRMRSRL